MSSSQKKFFFRLVCSATAVTLALLAINTYINLGRWRFEYYDNTNSFQPPRVHEWNSNSTGDINYMLYRSNTTDTVCDPKINLFNETHHIAFLKVHKCASTTVQNILYRFGLKRNLNFVLPVEGNYIRFGANEGLVSTIPPPRNSDYDILCNHVTTFNKSRFDHLLPSNTVYLAVIREPFQRMQSAFEYYRNVFKNPRLRKIQGSNPFETYLANPNYFESRWKRNSYTNNNMARDFGFPFSDFGNRKKFVNYLAQLDKTFDLVMLRELFEESLVLARRLLNWSMKDIVFVSLNTNAYKSPTVHVSDVPKSVEPYLALDYALYEHFLLKLKRKIKSEGKDFEDEVVYFRRVNNNISVFCVSESEIQEVEFSANNWHGGFKISREDCSFMRLSGKSSLKLVRDIQVQKIKKCGPNLMKQHVR